MLSRIVAIMALAVALSAVSLLGSPARPAPNASAIPAMSIDAYRGLATWVSIYDHRAWADPAAAVRDMAAHGVRTIFIQTGNSGSAGDVYDPAGQEEFIRAAHSAGLRVVAWYLPKMVDLDFDYARIAAAIRFGTSDSQSFDGFALDIESTAVHDVDVRNRALDALAKRVRGLVGATYKLGGIVPSPVGIAKQTGFWDAFPWTAVARDFDVIVPMGYYTYHGKGPAAATADVAASLRLLRAEPGCANVPVHFIGGLAAKTNAAEVRAFADAARAGGCIGFSLYSWSGTTASKWQALEGSAP